MARGHRDYAKGQPEHDQRTDTVSVSRKAHQSKKEGKTDVKFAGGRAHRRRLFSCQGIAFQ